MGNLRTQNFFLGMIGIGFLLVSFVMPASHWLERIIFIEDACWTLSWILIAVCAFREGRPGFPVAALPVTLAVELYLSLHYTVIESWPYNRWLLINYILWPVCTCLNVLAAFILISDSRRKLGLVFVIKTGIYFLIFSGLARFMESGTVMLYFGQTVIAMISFYFLRMILETSDTRGISLTGNVLRFTGGLLCYILNSLFRDPNLYLKIIMPLIVVLDAIFLFVYVRKIR